PREATEVSSVTAADEVRSQNEIPLYPTPEKVMFDGNCVSNVVTTGFHNVHTTYKFAEGDFMQSLLFQRYYGNGSAKRGVFPSQSFVEFGNRDFSAYVLDASKLSGKALQSQASYVIKRLFGLFDAIDRKYVKELHVRLLSQGNGNDNDGIEMFVFNFTYGSTPLITLNMNGEPVSLSQLQEKSSELMDSVNALFETILNMATTLPSLSDEAKPHLTIWMKKADDAPEDYLAPGYPPGPLYGIIRYPRTQQVVYNGNVMSNDINTGFHKMRISYKFAEGNFTESELFQRYYGTKISRRIHRRVRELSINESFETETNASSAVQEERDQSSDDESQSQYCGGSRFRSLYIDSDEDSEDILIEVSSSAYSDNDNE
ncbi:HORMA domain-containing protein 1-like isoform X2, partial [Leptotrombidium deliense]